MKTAESSNSPRIEQVEWLDAVSSSGWLTPDGVVNDASTQVQMCVSVGFNVFEDDNQIVLAGTVGFTGFSQDDGSYESNNRMAIPKGWIKRRQGM